MAEFTRSEVQALLAEQLAKDPEFRDRLLADPRGVIEELVGMPIAAAVQITVHEESLSEIHLTIPRAAAGGLDDLAGITGGQSSDELNMWAGTIPSPSGWAGSGGTGATYG